MITKISKTYKHIKTFANTHRVWMLTIALFIFAIGSMYSVRNLNLHFSDIDLLPLGIALIITAPIAVLLNSIEFMLCAKAVRQNIPLLKAIQVSTLATISNVLPFPAGLMLRGGVLVSGGASMAATSRILLIAGLMWAVIACLFSGMALLTGVFSYIILLGGLTIILALTYWVSRISNMKIALGFIGVRTCMLLTITFHLRFCFAAIGFDISFKNSAVYAISSVVGVVISILPAGLGVVETVGAGLAEIAGASPSAAFLALSISRLVGLSIAGGIVLALTLISTKKYIGGNNADSI